MLAVSVSLCWLFILLQSEEEERLGGHHLHVPGGRDMLLLTILSLAPDQQQHFYCDQHQDTHAVGIHSAALVHSAYCEIWNGCSNS